MAERQRITHPRHKKTPKEEAMEEVERQEKKWLWFDWGTRSDMISNFEPHFKRH